MGQFAVSIAMLFGVFVVTRQVAFMRSQNPGFDRAQTLVLEGPNTLPDSTYTGVYASFKNEILQIPGVQSIAGSSSVPGEEIYWTNSFRRLKNVDEQRNTLYILGVDATASTKPMCCSARCSGSSRCSPFLSPALVCLVWLLTW